jgi:uncharacterized DUF497 family protein
MIRCRCITLMTRTLIGEQRFICFGLSELRRVLAVIYTEPSENRIRIIRAREATRREEQSYEAQSDLT